MILIKKQCAFFAHSIMASPPRRFAVRWPAPDGGSSFGWRLIFSVHFPSREKEQKSRLTRHNNCYKLLKKLNLIVFQHVRNPY